MVVRLEYKSARKLLTTTKTGNEFAFVMFVNSDENYSKFTSIFKVIEKKQVSVYSKLKLAS